MDCMPKMITLRSILGRPFLRTVGATIDMKQGNIRFQFPLKRAWNALQERK